MEAIISRNIQNRHYMKNKLKMQVALYLVIVTMFDFYLDFDIISSIKIELFYVIA